MSVKNRVDNKKQIQLTVRLPIETHEKLVRCSKSEQRSLNSMIIYLINNLDFKD